MGKKIAIVGAGAVGCQVGGHMAANGEDVIFIDGWPEHVDKMNRDGLHLTGVTEAENKTVPVRAIHMSDVQSLSKGDPIDIAFVCMKSYDTEWATYLIKPYLAPQGFVVSLQNCMNEEFIAKIVGWGKVTGLIAAKISVDLVGPAHVNRNVPLLGNSHTVFRAGEVHGEETDRIKEVARLCAYTDSAMVTKNLWGERWSKLCLNASGNGVAASTGLGAAAIADDPHLRMVKIKLAAESIAVGKASGFKLEKMKGVATEVYEAAVKGDAASRKILEDGLIAEASKGNPNATPSMGQDMRKGRRTEIDYMNGLVVAKGRENGIPTPVNEGLIAAVKKVERGEAKASPALLAGL
jgi:2-dehydropantoate 2-reductase